jgi:outer membrane protein OmpA-like peptidoglycan-associated protein
VEVLLADKRLGPLAAEAFDITLPDGRMQRAVTNQQGLCRIESIPAGRCRIQFRPAKGHPPNGANTEWNKLELGLTVGTDEQHKLEVDHNQAEIVEVDDAQFFTNSSVLVPVDAAQWGVNGLSMVGHALRYASENANRTLMIVGHADNQEGARAALAAKRAKALEAILKGDAKAYVAACVDPNQAATPALLDWARDHHGYHCDPKAAGPAKPEAKQGKVDSVQAALVHFRKEHNRREQTLLDEAAQGMVAADYEAFFKLYERTLADQLDVELSELSSVRSKLKFHSVPTLGAESEWPKPTGAGAKQLRSHSSRRVDLMFLENDHPIPKLDDTAVSAEHFFVDERRVRRSYLPPRGAVVVVTPYTSADIDQGVDAAFKLVGPGYSSTIKLSERSKHAKDHFDVKYTELEFNLVPTEGELKLSVTPNGGAESVLFENVPFAELLDDGAADGR